MLQLPAAESARRIFDVSALITRATGVAGGRQKQLPSPMSAVVQLLAALLLLLSPAAAQIDWAPLRSAIDAFADVPDCAVYLGDGSGLLFHHLKGATTNSTSMPVASATKWLGATAIVALVEEGSVGLDDLISEWLDWWPRDALLDSRARITLRHW